MIRYLSNKDSFLISNINILLIPILFLLFFIPNTSHARTTVSGEVCGTWTADEGPYMVEDTLIVPQGHTLNIEPGVEVIINPSIQDIPDLLIIVEGSLQAVGTVSDSIYFTSPGGKFDGFRVMQNNFDDLFHLEYVSINSTKQFIEADSSSLVIKHCNIVSSQVRELTVGAVGYNDFYISNYCIDIIEHNTFYWTNPLEFLSKLVIKMYYGTGLVRFQNNTAIHFDLSIRYKFNNVEPLFNNNIDRIGLSLSSADVYDNIIYDFSISDGDALFTNNHSNRANQSIFARFDGGAFYIADNIFSYLDIYQSIGELIVENNKISWLKIREFDDAIVRYNIIDEQYDDQFYGSRIENGNSIEEYNNTLRCFNNGMYFYNTPTVSAFNNILIGNYEYYAFYISNISDAEVINNCMYNFSADLFGNSLEELDTSNFVADPILRESGANPYVLRADSPCIDAGDPASPFDPDSTVADLGAFFYDQRLDNPPTITSVNYIDSHAGSYFSYTARAVDDFGPLSFSFLNLPEGITEQAPELDWIADSATVVGYIPDDIPGFTFTVVAEDVIAQSDTQYVYVNLEAMHVLQGEISGTLSVEDSPYLVVDNIIIPEGDTLNIEAGTIVYFRPESNQFEKLKIESYGTLIAMGTEEDSITFSPPGIRDNYYHGSWAGIFLNSGEIADTSFFNHVKIINSQEGIYADSVTFSVANSFFYNNYEGLTAENFTQLNMINSEFNSDDDFSFPYYFTLGFDTYSIIDSCRFILTGEREHTQTNMMHGQSGGIIRNCYFYGGRNVMLSGVDFYNNMVENFSYYAQSANGVYSNIRNNVFTDIAGLYFGNSYNITFSNNIITNTAHGLDISEYIEDAIVINNIFYDNETVLFYEDENENFANIAYNCYFNNDSVSVHEQNDETNLFTNPLFADEDFFLLTASPCIDAGNPDEAYNDIDGSRNDIGLYGGPYGQSYEYPETIPTLAIDDEGNELPSEFKLLPPYPNPFNSMVVVPFQITGLNETTLTIYNILGQVIIKKDMGRLNPGNYSAIFDFKDKASGNYFIELISGEQKTIRKITKLN